jgi:hypothetical protein
MSQIDEASIFYKQNQFVIIIIISINLPLNQL